MGDYKQYELIRKEVLDSISIGDLIKINSWKKPMRVAGVTENYCALYQNVFGIVIYSIIEKKPWGGVMYNSMMGGMFHCGTDNWIFGADFQYEFEDKDAVHQYLLSFESGESELSVRRAVPIYAIAIKKEKK